MTQNIDLILDFDGKQVIDSRRVAQMVGKRHRDLMRDIRRYISTLKKSAKLRTSDFFIESSFEQGRNGKENPCYLCTKQGCEMVANKLTGEKGIIFTAEYVAAFNEHERLLKKKDNYPIPATYGEALQLAADLQKKVEHNAPKVKYFDEQMRNPGLMTITIIAKSYGWSAVKMNKYLCDKGVIYKQGKHWVLYEKYANQGLADYEGFPYKHNSKVHENLKWTQKGQHFIYELLRADGILPIIHQPELFDDFDN